MNTTSCLASGRRVGADHPSWALDTTRSPRPGETNGKEYHFVTREQFVSLVDQGGFIENAQFSGNLYGTSVKAVQDVGEQGRRCILDIDAQVGSSILLCKSYILVGFKCFYFP